VSAAHVHAMMSALTSIHGHRSRDWAVAIQYAA
jgi:hypothetical protein